MRFDSALAAYHGVKREELNIWADPACVPRNQTTGNEHGGAYEEFTPVVASDRDDQDEGNGTGTVVAATFGGSAPSTTPQFRGASRRWTDGGDSLPNVKIEGFRGSPLSTLPSAPAADLYTGGKIGGAPLFDVKEVGTALDQLAREILRHLRDHKLTVVWLFDESVSMQDDQRAIVQKFDGVSTELKRNIDPSKKSAGALNHAIVGFGQQTELVLAKPTSDIDNIARAIKKLPSDMSGIENTMQAIIHTVDAFAGTIGRDRRLLLVLVTDESGDDGADVEEARQRLLKYRVPLYVIGRQALFGYPFARHRYVDPVTKDIYYPIVHRGPETADVESYQWDGLYTPSGSE
jgi:hypothetical protein